jgi:murein L,D-transpeptidase YcbB/YkuD
VNITESRLRVVSEDSTVLAMRAIVGRADRPTPTLSSRITHLEVNPSWNIPQRLARDDVLPQVHADPEYLLRNDIRVFADWSPQAPRLDPLSVDWPAIVPDRLAFKLQQAPGPQNPLGRVKFMFANPFAVYIHDTPHRGKFRAAERFFSSGCVRVEDPLALAHALIAAPQSDAAESLQSALEGNATRAIDLPRSVPVHLTYLTAWADDDGTLHFRDDAYGYDRMLVEGLAAISEPAGKLPGAERTGVQVDEAGTGIVADATAAETQGDATQFGRGKFRQAHVHGASQQVVTPAGHAATLPAQGLVGGGGPVAADDVEGFRAAQPLSDGAE